MKSIASLAAIALGLSALGCGSAATAPESESAGKNANAIVDGYKDDTDLAVMSISLSFGGGGGGGGHCTGTLIAPNLVLTARHCIALTEGGGPQGSVVCGSTGFGFQGPGTIFRVTPDYGQSVFAGTGTVRPVPGTNDICGHDIALIILEGAGVPESVTKPIIPRIDSRPEPGDFFSAVGYGLTDPNGQSGGTRMRVDDNEVRCRGGSCAGFIGSSIKDTEWYGTARTCPGDSGGPAIDALGRVMGVLSRGPSGCLSSVYGDVGAWGDFVIEVALEAAQLAGFEPPFWATTKSSTPPDGGAPGSDGGEPPIGSPLGETCTGGCRDGYLCISEDGVTGVCMAPCSAANAECPDGYACDASVGACLLPSAPPKSNAAGDDGGCSVSSKGPAKPVPWIVALGLATMSLRRRRRRASAVESLARRP